MGRDLLGEDYMLKQITASLIYPEDEIGKKFWKRIYEEAQKRYGTTNIPVNTFNKVWIVPDKAVVYENAQAGTAYVVESKLKVMLEQDYLSMEKHQRQSGDMFPAKRGTCPQAGCQANEGLNVKVPRGNPPTTNELGSNIVREIVIPELNREINESKNFTQLRQVYNSLILATWYKKKIKDSILEQVYANKNKVKGIEPLVSLRGAQATKQYLSTNDVEFIYHRYLQAFKKGVYNYIQQDVNPSTKEKIPRKYFSGGEDLNLGNTWVNPEGILSVIENIPNTAMISNVQAMLIETDVAPFQSLHENESLGMKSSDQAMKVPPVTKIYNLGQELPKANPSNKNKGSKEKETKAADAELITSPEYLALEDLSAGLNINAKKVFDQFVGEYPKVIKVVLQYGYRLMDYKKMSDVKLKSDYSLKDARELLLMSLRTYYFKQYLKGQATIIFKFTHSLGDPASQDEIDEFWRKLTAINVESTLIDEKLNQLNEPNSLAMSTEIESQSPMDENKINYEDYDPLKDYFFKTRMAMKLIVEEVLGSHDSDLFNRQIRFRKMKTIVAMKGSEVIGFASFTNQDNRALPFANGKLEWIAVKKAYQRGRIGSILLTKVVHELEVSGKEGMVLSVIQKNNAKGFYQRFVENLSVQSGKKYEFLFENLPSFYGATAPESTIKFPFNIVDGSSTGGIDLSPAKMNLQTQNAGIAIKFHLDPAMLAQLQNAPGFVPVIIYIQPMKDIRHFLGIVSQLKS
jgi:ribosomal protein S18 acetylase RimI-like enzyme